MVTRGTARDMTAPNWARTLKRLRRMAEELRAHDVQVIEPPNFELPPGRRYAQGGSRYAQADSQG